MFREFLASNFTSHEAEVLSSHESKSLPMSFLVLFATINIISFPNQYNLEPLFYLFQERVVKNIADMSCKCLVAWNSASFKSNVQVLRYFNALLIAYRKLYSCDQFHFMLFMIISDYISPAILYYFISFPPPLPKINAAFEFMEWTSMDSRVSLIL